MRLNKYLAACGVASRRSSDELIAAGHVSVNGQMENRLGVLIDPEHDRVSVSGQPVRSEAGCQYYMLNKPVGCLTTVTDPFGRPTVMSYMQGIDSRVFPVGRLDFDTEGLLLFSNDGALTQALTHPRYGIEKEYRALVQGRPDEAALRPLRTGVPLAGFTTAPAVVAIEDFSGRETVIKITIHEGRKRQIRYMMDYVGFPVLRLQRVRIGPVKLGNLAVGKQRPLSAAEIAALRKVVDQYGASR